MGKIYERAVRFKTAMSSKEVVKLTGKKHTNVLRDIGDQLFTGLYDVAFSDSNISYPETQQPPALAGGLNIGGLMCRLKKTRLKPVDLNLELSRVRAG